METTLSAVCAELESVREQHSSAQLSAREEKSAMQQQLHTTQERLAALSTEKESEKVPKKHNIDTVYYSTSIGLNS